LKAIARDGANMSTSIDLLGTYTAIVTPFRDDDAQSIDEAAFDALIEAQVAGGVRGIVPCGTPASPPRSRTRSTTG